MSVQPCPTCHHLPTVDATTLGEVSPGRYGDDEAEVTITCYCECHRNRASGPEEKQP